MQSTEHLQHIAQNVAHSNCSECRADNERRFAQITPFRYAHVHKYLTYVQPRLAAIQAGENSVNARIWHRDFMRAMHKRISSRLPVVGRKWSDGYRERIEQFRDHYTGQWRVDAPYLRQFSRRGASALV